MAKVAVKKIPKNLGDAVDLYYKTRTERLAAQKEVDKLEEFEKQLKEHLIESIPKSKIEGVKGKLALAQIVRKVVPTIGDDTKFYAYIKKTGAFDLLQRRLNTKAVEERWAAKKNIPGIEEFQSVTVSITKAK